MPTTLTYHGYQTRNFLLKAGGINKCVGILETRSAYYPLTARNCQLRPCAFFCRYMNATKSFPCGALMPLRSPHKRLSSSSLSPFRHSLVLVSCATMHLYQKDPPFPGNTRILGLYVNSAASKKTRCAPVARVFGRVI